MDTQSILARRLEELRKQKEVLRAVQSDLQKQSLPLPRPALLTSAQPSGNIYQYTHAHLQLLPKSVENIPRASVDLPPTSSSTTQIPHNSSLQSKSSPRPKSLSKQSTEFSTKLGRSNSQTLQKTRPPAIPDLIGTIGADPVLPPVIPDDSPINDSLDDSLVSANRHIEGAPLRYEALINQNCFAGRPTRAMRFHTKYDNVLFTAHGAPSNGRLVSAQGMIAVWSLDLPQPSLQRTLNAAAPITSLEVFPLSSTLVLAGTSVGSVLMWDLRVQTNLPISAFDTDFTDVSDCHARRRVTSLRTTVVSSPFFMSTSTTGHVCKWSLSQPHRPLSQTVLHDSVMSGRVPITAIDFPASTRLSADERKVTNRAPSFFATTLHGSVCRVETDGKLWSVSTDRGEHGATVTAVRAHPAGIRVPHLDDIIATSSHDWTVNVWSFRRGQECKKLWSYDNISNGIVNDVAWSQAHPTVLCSGDEAGVLSLFDLSGRLQNPKSQSSSWRFALPDIVGRTPITSLQWSNNDRFLCAGDDGGNVHVWSTTSSMASLPDAEWTAHFLKSKAVQSK